LKFWLWALIIIVFGMGCGSHAIIYQKPLLDGNGVGRIEIYIDKNFDPMDRKEIAAGIAEWEKDLNGNLHLVAVDWEFDMEIDKLKKGKIQKSWYLLKINSDNPIAPGKITMQDGSINTPLAFVEDIGGNNIYYIRDRITWQGIKEITMHEIGHTLGLSHGKWLMGPTFSNGGYECVDQYTMKEIAKMWNFRMSSLNYCIR
jgi:hypothetical protein